MKKIDIIIGILRFMLIGLLCFTLFQIAERHGENVENMRRLCNNIGVEYSTKTNVFGHVSRIYIKEMF